MEKIADHLVSRDRKVLFFCHSLVHILNAYIIFRISDVPNHNVGFVILYFNDSDKKVNTEISNRLKSLGIRCYHIFKGKKTLRLLGINGLVNSHIYRGILRDMGVDNDNYLLVNYSWNQKFIHYPASVFFKKAAKIILIEEGITQYSMPDQSSAMMLIRKVLGDCLEFWKDSRLEGIYVQRPLKYNAELQPYLTQFSYDLSETNLKKVAECYKIFMREDERTIFSQYCSGDFGVIFTQPLSEDGYITEKEKIGIYSSLIKKYSEYGEPILKVHPRDYSDYGNICKYIDYGKYPSELFLILGIRVRYAVGVCTSAIYSVQTDMRINVNENFLNDRLFFL